MEIKILQNDNNSCIVFFNGWGMDQHAIENLSGNYDLIVFQNYTSLEYSFEQAALSKYENLYLIAWSYGVAVANYIVNGWNVSFKKSVAINGTPYIGHDLWGIPESLLEATKKGWSEISHRKFNLRMYGGRQSEENLKWSKSERSTPELGAELQNLLNNKHVFQTNNLEWDKAIISKEDKIIPSKNQYRYWFDKVDLIKLEGAHFPFEHLKQWNEIIDGIK